MKKFWLPILGVGILCFGLYWPTLYHDFIWDDHGVVVQNPNFEDFQSALGTFYKGNRTVYVAGDPAALTACNYRPIRTVVHFVIQLFFDRQPFYFHLVNILVHFFNSVLLLFFFNRIFKKTFAAFISSSLFATHPINTEAVCWVKSLEDLLAAFFLLTTLHLCFQWRSIWKASSACFAFSLSLLSKISCAFYPIFYFYWMLSDQRDSKLASRKSQVRHIVFTAILCAEVLIVLVLRHHVLGKTGQGDYLTGSCWTTWLSMPGILLRYLRLEIAPFGLLADYWAIPTYSSIASPFAWGEVMILTLFLLVGTIIFFKLDILNGWVWYWTALLPFMNIVPMVQLGAERFLYIPTIGLVWLIGDLYLKISYSWKRYAFILFCLILAFFTILSYDRIKDWKDEISLWSKELTKYPKGLRIRRNLVRALIRADRVKDALPHAFILHHQRPDDLWLLGYALCLDGQIDAGIKCLRKAKSGHVLNHLGLKSIKDKQPINAGVYFYVATQVSPENPVFLKNYKQFKKDYPQLSPNENSK